MKKYINFISVSLFIFIFVGCSSKSLYEPKKVAGYVSFDGRLPAPIADVTRSGATLQNGQVISKKTGLMNVFIPKNNRFLNISKNRVIYTSPMGKLSIKDKNNKVLFSHNFSKMIASASLKNNLLAIVFSDNSLMVYDIKNNIVKFSKKLDDVYALDARLVAPYFLGKLIVFPSLDGRLVIIDSNRFKVIRDIVVSSKPYFNNVIFMDVLDNRLVAATQKRVISIDPKSVSFMNVGVKDILFLGERIFVFTKDGKIILTNSNLKRLKERKFKFANFSTAIYGQFIYVIEKNGYLIATDKDLITTNVYKLPDAIENLMFTTSDTLYYDDKYFKLNKIK